MPYVFFVTFTSKNHEGIQIIIKPNGSSLMGNII